MKLKELLSQIPYTCYLEIHSYEDNRELIGWLDEMEKELEELGDYTVSYFEPMNESRAGLKICIHSSENRLKVSTGGETVKLDPGVGIGVDPKYIAAGWPYETRNPKYPLQSEEEAKKVKIATVQNMQTNLGEIEKAQKYLSQKEYYVIHKLRENEKLIVGDASQLVTAVEQKWMAEDICKRYKFYNSGYEKLAYARVPVDEEKPNTSSNLTLRTLLDVIDSYYTISIHYDANYAVTHGGEQFELSAKAYEDSLMPYWDKTVLSVEPRPVAGSEGEIYIDIELEY